MWIKSIDVTDVKSVGFDNKNYEGSPAIVKRVTVEFDVVMLPVHDEYSDPLERVQKNMDHQMWYLRDPVIDAVYRKKVGKAEGPPLPTY